MNRRTFIALLPLPLLTGCSLFGKKKDSYLKETFIPAADVHSAMAEAARIIQEVEGHQGLNPPTLRVKPSPSGRTYTKLYFGADTRNFYGADLFIASAHVGDHGILVHEMVHIRRRTNDHDPRYRGKVKYW